MAIAKVTNIDALRDFKIALHKFAEKASVALSDAESEMQRIQTWLEGEQSSYWNNQVRKRTEIVMRCKDAVRQKKLFKNAVGGRDSVVDEEKALAIAQRKLEQAEQKARNVKMHSRKLQKEVELYKGSAQRLATTVHVDIPAAANKIENLLIALANYLALHPTEAGAIIDQAFGATTMARSADEKKDEKAENLPPMNEGQVAIGFADAESGLLVLTADGELFDGEGERYVVADSVDAARQLAAERSAGGQVRCIIYDREGKELEVIGAKAAEQSGESGTTQSA